MECYIILIRLPLTDAILLSWCLLLLVQDLGLEVTVNDRGLVMVVP